MNSNVVPPGPRSFRAVCTALPPVQTDCSNWDADSSEHWSNGKLIAASKALPPVEAAIHEQQKAAATSPFQNGSIASVRVIKLSEDDPEMRTEEEMEKFFTETLTARTPTGKFCHGDRKDKVDAGDRLIFAYKGKIVYLAKALEGRRDNKGETAHKYPYYFRIEVASIEPANGDLVTLEQLLHETGLYQKNVAKGRGWPHIRVSHKKERELDIVLEQLRR